MWHWLMQIFLLLTFATISASVDRRRTGLILSGFALVYLALMPFAAEFMSFSPPLYVLMSAALDMVAVRLLLVYGDKGSKSQAVILCAFVTTHLMAYLYTVGWPSVIDPHQYVVITMTLATLQILIALPGARDGLYEMVDMVKALLENSKLRGGLARLYRGGPDGSAVSLHAVSGYPDRTSGYPGIGPVLQDGRLAGGPEKSQQQDGPVV